MSEHIVERNHFNVINVIEDLHRKVICQGISEHIVERNHSCVTSVTKHFHGNIT